MFNNAINTYHTIKCYSY